MKEPPPTPEEIAYRKFSGSLSRAFDAHFAPVDHASFMLDIIADEVFDSATLRPRPIERQALLTYFASDHRNLTTAQGVAALGLLAEKGIIELVGDHVVVAESVLHSSQAAVVEEAATSDDIPGPSN